MRDRDRGMYELKRASIGRKFKMLFVCYGRSGRAGSVSLKPRRHFTNTTMSPVVPTSFFVLLSMNQQIPPSLHSTLPVDSHS
jgi:hypothetical protein